MAKKTNKKNHSPQTEDIGSSSTTGDPNALVQSILRESYLQTSEDLKYYAEKVKHFNQQKKAIREYLQALRCAKRKIVTEAHERRLDTMCPSADHAKQLKKLIQLHAHSFNIDPLEAELGLPDRVPAEKVDSLDEFENEIAKWEEKLVSLGDDAQLANVDLQNILQKAQQTLQMMSNISKMLHDNAMSIIRKIGG